MTRIVIEDRGDAIEQIGLLTTDPRWAHIESPLLLAFALAVLDALAMRDRVSEWETDVRSQPRESLQ